MEESAIEFRIVRDKRPLSEGWRTPWILMHKRRTLYRRVAGVEPNDAVSLDLELAKRLWRNPLSSHGIASISSEPSQNPPQSS